MLTLAKLGPDPLFGMPPDARLFISVPLFAGLLKGASLPSLKNFQRRLHHR